MKWEATFRESGYTAMEGRNVRKILKGSMEDVGRAWHTKFRKKHFQQSAFARYGYTPRSRMYESFKLKKLGHRRPLVFTGRTREDSKRKRFQSKHNTVHVIMPVQGLNRRARGSKVRMGQEFRRIIAEEERIMEQTQARSVEERIKKSPVRKRTKIR